MTVQNIIQDPALENRYQDCKCSVVKHGLYFGLLHGLLATRTHAEWSISCSVYIWKMFT